MDKEAEAPKALDKEAETPTDLKGGTLGVLQVAASLNFIIAHAFSLGDTPTVKGCNDVEIINILDKEAETPKALDKEAETFKALDKEAETPKALDQDAETPKVHLEASDQKAFLGDDGVALLGKVHLAAPSCCLRGGTRVRQKKMRILRSKKIKKEAEKPFAFE